MRISPLLFIEYGIRVWPFLLGGYLKGYQTVMVPSEKDGLNRVRVGSFQSLTEARKYAKAFEEMEKLPTFISEIK